MTRVTRFLQVAAAVSMCVAFAPGAAAQDPCKLFPGSPEMEFNPGYCTALYWPKVPTKTFGGLHEYGAMISIQQHPGETPAQAQLARYKGTPVSYGNGGVEVYPPPGTLDLRTPTADEIRTKTMHGDISDLITVTSYSLIFRCGSSVVTVHANVSKIQASQQLATELVKNMSTSGACASGASPAIAANTTAPAPAPPQPVTTPPPADDREPGGTRYFDGNTARAIVDATNSGARYMVVLGRTWDPAQNCFLEQRAWVSSITASSSDRVGAAVGPSRTVCVKGNVMNQDAVNQAEARLARYRNELTKALQKKAELEPYLKDPNYKTWAAGEIAKIDTYIASYENYINQTQAVISGSAP